MFVDGAAMSDSVERQHPVRVVRPEEQSVIADPVLMQAFEVGRHVLQGKSQDLGMLAQPLDLGDYASSHVAV